MPTPRDKNTDKSSSAEPVEAPNTMPPAEKSTEVEPQVPQQGAQPAETKSDLLSVEEVTREVLGGRWGSTAAEAMDKLEKKGYDVDAVWAEYQRRKAGGAPTAF